MSDPTNPFQNRNDLKDHFEIERLRAELAAANERSRANYTRWIRSEEEAEARETALRAELTAVKADCEHGYALSEARLAERDALRAELAAAMNRVRYLEHLVARKDAAIKSLAGPDAAISDIDAALKETNDEG